ncbi:MAG: hypothetical protein M0010_02745 [Actinomycetota bacterium]|nr:hypothetical protein [Actinomycetota bacterium]
MREPGTPRWHCPIQGCGCGHFWRRDPAFLARLARLGILKAPKSQ